MNLTILLPCFFTLLIMSMSISMVLVATTAIYLFCLLTITYIPKISLLLPELLLR